MSKQRIDKPTPAELAFRAGCSLVYSHPLWSSLFEYVWVSRDKDGNPCMKDCWLVVTPQGRIWANPQRVATAQEWAYMLAHGLLYLAWGSFQQDRAYWPQWNAACDLVAARFLQGLKFGVPPQDKLLPAGVPARDEETWYRAFCSEGVPEDYRDLGPGSATQPGMWIDAPVEREWRFSRKTRRAQLFADGLRNAMHSALETAATAWSPAEAAALKPVTQRARSWFLSSFPLLGATVATFDFIEDAEVCRRSDIRIAAVNETLREIYLNPHAGLNEFELRFVIAHEVLHVGLRHLDRRQGRDPFLWNVACDFVINQWLIDMEVGTPPEVGGLHDPQLKGLSAEAVYDRITQDLRRYRKLTTLAGAQCDVLERAAKGKDTRDDKLTDLDEFYRSQLAKGLALHQQQGRGLLPAGLVEEIRALSQPPIAWDVELARWFDARFPPIEKRRSYARLSRRQDASPDIPRPCWSVDDAQREGRVFGVVLDTSGSMNRHLLAQALGAIASYSAARDVAAARVIFCDAQAYDAGYMPPEDIAGRVQVRGRGGTVLQPGIDLLDKAPDFPQSGPLLVVTDGDCDRVCIRRDHALLIPRGARLPFTPAGPVFYLQ